MIFYFVIIYFNDYLDLLIKGNNDINLFVQGGSGGPGLDGMAGRPGPAVSSILFTHLYIELANKNKN